MGASPAAGYLQQEEDGMDIWGGRAALGRLLQPLLLFSCRVRAGSTLRGRWSQAGCCS